MSTYHGVASTDYQLASYLADKRVVLVGPAASLLGRRQGSLIDSFDVIVRLNLAVPATPEHYADIGSRTDILYHVLFNNRMMHTLKRTHDAAEIKSWKDDGVQWIVTRQSGSSDRLPSFKRVLGNQIPLIMMPEGYVDKLRSKVHILPSTGTIAITHLLDYPISSLFVTGFDFYKTGYYEGYGGFTKEQAEKGRGGKGLWGQSSWTNHVPHPQEPQIKYLAALSGRDNRLSFDDIASEILGISKEDPCLTAIVPIKEHSERVPGKNFKELNGKPLFYWTLNALLQAKHISRVVVDADSDKVQREVSRLFPGIRVIRRPDSLLGDDVVANDLIEWELTQLDDINFLQTHVTNPLLTSKTIDEAVEAYFEADNFDSLVGVTEYKARWYHRNGKAIMHSPHKLGKSQDLEPLYQDNSNLYIFNRQTFALNRSRIGAWPQMFVMSKLEAVDIDYAEDFALAEALMRMSHA